LGTESWINVAMTVEKIVEVMPAINRQRRPKPKEGLIEKRIKVRLNNTPLISISAPWHGTCLKDAKPNAPTSAPAPAAARR
jgi:hypothetical protein